MLQRNVDDGVTQQQRLLMDADRAFISAHQHAGNCLSIIQVYEGMSMRLQTLKDKYFTRNREGVQSSLDEMKKQAHSYAMNAGMPPAWLVRNIRLAEKAKTACKNCSAMQYGEIRCGVLDLLSPALSRLEAPKQYQEFLEGKHSKPELPPGSASSQPQKSSVLTSNPFSSGIQR